MPRRPNMNDEELREWFFNHKTVSDNGCWEWNGVKIKDGYGMLSVKGKRFLVHRYAMILHLGRDIEDKTEIRHMCHNTSCFNPDHLREGTHQQNMTDMVIAGRQAKGEHLKIKTRGIPHLSSRGEGNGRSKMTNDQVLEIRRLSETLSHREIAKQFNVSKTTITAIICRRTWKNV